MYAFLFIMFSVLMFASLVVSLCSGEQLSEYGCRGRLIVEGAVYPLSKPLEVVGTGCGDLDLHQYVPSFDETGEEYFLIAFDALRKEFTVEPALQYRHPHKEKTWRWKRTHNEPLNIYRIREGRRDEVTEPVVLESGDQICVEDYEEIEIVFQAGGKG